MKSRRENRSSPLGGQRRADERGGWRTPGSAGVDGDAPGVSPKTRGIGADPTLIPRRIPKGGPRLGGCSPLPAPCSSVPPKTRGGGSPL